MVSHFDINGACMGQILVRNLDDPVIARIKSRAKANRRSIEAEVREILSQAVAGDKLQRRSLASFIGAAGLSRSREEIDAYVRVLRNEWDR
jgi:plasmid stability protein